MNTSLRQKLAGDSFKRILWPTVAVAMLLSSLPVFFVRNQQSHNWLVSINGKALTAEDFQQEAVNIQRSLQLQYGPLASMAFARITPYAIYDSMMVRVLNGQFADKLGVHASDELAFKQLTSTLEVVGKSFGIEVVNSDGSLNEENLQKLSGGTTVSEFQELVKDNIARVLVENLARSGAYVSAAQAERSFVRLNGKRTYKIASVGLERFVKEVEAKGVKEADIAAFYQAKSAQGVYTKPEMRSGLVYEFSRADYALGVTKAELQEYYNKNKHREFVASPAQVKVRHLFMPADAKNKNEVRAQVAELFEEARKNPAVFVELIKKHSKSTDAAQGGVVDFFAFGAKDPEFAQAAFAIAAENEFAPLVETDAGFEIIQLLGRKAATFKDFAAVEAQIRQKVETAKFDAAFKRDVRGIQMKENKLEDLKKFAATKKAASRTLALSKKSDKSETVALFKAYKNSFDYYIAGDKGYVVVALEVKPAHQQQLAQIKDQVRRDYIAEAARQLMDRFLGEVRRELASKKIEEIAKAHTMDLAPVEFNFAADEKAIKDIEAKIGSPVLQNAALMNYTGQAAVVVDNNQGKIIQLVNITAPSSMKFEDKRTEVAAQTELEEAQLLAKSLFASLIRTGKIEINESLSR